MNLVRTQFDRIQLQLAALSMSQKMLAASLLTIMVMTLFYWVHYAASPEYSPVLDQTLSTEDSGRIASYLRDRGYDVRITSDRVMVPSDRQMQAVAELTYAQQMPQNMTDGFDVIIKEMNPFDSADKTDVMWNQAKEITVGGIIQRWDGVVDAKVVIDNTTKRGLSIDDSIQPSAAVNIRMRDGVKPDKRLAAAAVHFLTGSVAGLDPARVSVIINGIPVNTDAGDGIGASDRIVDLQHEQEDYLAKKIKDALGYMQAPVFAEVSVEVDAESVTKDATTVDPKNSLYKPLEEQTTSDETTAAQPGASEPGLGANIQANVASAADNSKNSSTKTEENNKYTLVPAQTVTHSVQGPGKVTPHSATVQIPRTYFLACYKQENPNAKDPDVATLQALFDQQMPAIKGAIRGCTGLTDDAISVGLYDPINSDIPTDSLAMAVDHGSGQSINISNILTNHIKDIAVAALAFISLFMVSMMVRKSTPQPVVTAVTPAPEPQAFENGEQVAGEAGEGNAMLDGMELDDDAIKTQQMIGQVSQMIKENPDGAANLVKRWLNHA